jgi:hypothetical protein
MEDLRIRDLASQGLDAASSEAAQLYRQQEQIRQAIAEGRSAAEVEELRRVQENERRRADEQRRLAQQQAFDAAFPTTSAQAIAQSATGVNLAIGVSESTAGQMVGIARAQLAYQATLPQISATLLRHERLLTAMLAKSGIGSIDELEEQFAVQHAAANRVAGNMPSNR